MTVSKMIDSYESFTNRLTEEFIVKYFELEEEDTEDGIVFYWVGGEVGGVFEFADYYINFSDVIFCLKNKVCIDKYFSYYYWNLNNHPNFINLQSFIWGASEIKQDILAKKKLAVERAEEVLKIAIEDYNNPT